MESQQHFREAPPSREHPLSWEALTRIVLVGITLLLIWKALGAVVVIVVALVLTASLHPVVWKFHIKTKFPILLSTFVVLLILLIPFAVLGFALIPNLNSQLPQMLTSINSTMSNLPYIGHYLTNFNIVSYTDSFSGDPIASSNAILQIAISVLATLVLTFYFVYDYERLLKLFLSIFPFQEKEKLQGFIEQVAKVTGQYIRGNVIISGITFLVIYVSLLALHIPYALPLALFAGVFDLLPLVGSTIGSIPAFFVAYSVAPVYGISVLIIHLVYQQIENAIISPAIYNKALNLYPALGFLAVIIGASLFGMLGAFLALPVAASIPVIVSYHENYKSRHKRAT